MSSVSRQPQVRAPSVPSRTWAATICALCSLPDLGMPWSALIKRPESLILGAIYARSGQTRVLSSMLLQPQHWLFGLVAWFWLRVREVLGSFPRPALLFGALWYQKAWSWSTYAQIIPPQVGQCASPPPTTSGQSRMQTYNIRRLSA